MIAWHSAAAQPHATPPQKAPRAPYSLEIMDDICRIAPSKPGHWDVDLLVVLFKVDLDVLMQLQLPSER